MNYLRPDEKAAQAYIEKSQMQNDRAKSLIKTGVNLATGIGGAGLAAKGANSLSSKIGPFINKYIPTDMAIKGISKVSPEIGRLLKKGMEQGLDIQDGLDFIKEKMQPKQEPAKENRNIIQQYSPELHQFLDQEIKNGRSPIQAGAIAQADKRFSATINKLMKDHKTPWSSIIESIYGNGQTAQVAQQTQPQAQSPQQNQPMKSQAQSGQQGDPLFQALMQGDSVQVAQLAGVNHKQAENLIIKFNQSQGSQQQPGAGQQALMATLQKINQRLGG